MTSAIVRCSGKAQGSPTATSRAAVALSTTRQAPCAGKPITASRTWAQAPQLLQVASEYVAGQIAIRLPAGVYRGNEAVRSRHSPIVSAHSSRRLLNRCRTALRAWARASVRDLMMRWFAVRETRVVESDDPVNYRYIDGRLESLTSEAAAPAQ